VALEFAFGFIEVWHTGFMQAIRLKATVDQDRELRLVVPGEVPLGPVEILLLSETDPPKKPQLSKVLHALGQHRTQTREALDRRLETERDSWE
jgi:hypothetical protein